MVDGGFIINRSFSHYEESSVTYGHSGGYMELSESKNSAAYLPGGSIGVTAALRINKCVEWIAGLSISQTRARYSYFESYPAGEVGLTFTTQITKTENHITALYLNYESGFRFKLFGFFFLQPSLLLNQNMQTIEKQDGTFTTVRYSNFFPGGPYTNYYNEDVQSLHTTIKYRYDFVASARLKASCIFNIHRRNYALFVFRNFSMVYKLPWWGLGVSVPL